MSFFLITGTSGAGKTFLSNLLAEQNIWEECISHTTRGMREGEKEGETYYYIDVEDFANMSDNEEFAEETMYHGNAYALSKKEISRVKSNGKNAFVIVNYDGYEQIKENYPEAIGIFIFEEEKNCFQNMVNRGDTIEQAISRLGTYEEEIGNKVEYDYVIKNKYGKIDETLEIIKKIVKQNE